MEAWALVMFAALFVLLLIGFPVAFTLGAVALLFGGIFLDFSEFQLLPMRVWGVMTNFTLLAVPLFVFMGVMLEKSGLAEALLETMGRLFGRVRGGLAVSIVVVGALLAATTGVVGATVVTMGLIALPAMLKHRYDAGLASGVIAASGTLGQIIPPSVILILLGDIVGIPVSDLFAAAVIPGMLLVVAFIVYVLVIAWLRPTVAPAIEVRTYASGKLLHAVIKSLLPPLILVLAVLGSIFFGIASPTESAALGALGAIILAATHGQLQWKNMFEAAKQTARLTSMVFIILIGATAFGLVFRSMGGDVLTQDIMLALPGEEYGFIAVSMLLIFVLGCFLDFLEICFIVVPILVPIAQQLNIELLWFSILIAMNLQASFLTPPFGFSLFYLKAVAPPEVRIQHIYRGVVPFIILQVLVLGLLVVFPGIVSWLPEQLNAIR
ncbi:MAG: TRAP transporter large permease subunit [Gammaproteobacteria bacterium]|nr:TRAP transporter large permease subunit [Gammaproteobacteria bacterium]